MPTYAYACTACDHRFEVRQSFSDSALSECPECSGSVRKLFNTVGIVFKGSGFYRTDSRAGQKSDGNGSGSDKAGSDKAGSDKAGSDKAGSDKAGSDKGGGSEKKADTATSSGSSTASSTKKPASSTASSGSAA